MDSPPKRMTRARAAAKATEPSVKTTKIVTAAARARSTATAGTKSTAAKRKTRADEDDKDEEQQREFAVVRRTRGRPRKAGEVEEHDAEPEAPARPRGRIIKKTATEAPKPTTTATVPAKPTRGRPKKAIAIEAPAPAPIKKTATIRTRTTTSTTTTKPTTKPTTLAKPALKKSVKFQEPDKENIEPAAEAKEPARPGIRGRPAKRGGAAGSRTTRAAVRSAESTENKPLSPKKITQIPVSKDDESEDELAGDMPPVKPMMKSPIKPPTSMVKPQPEQTEEQTESISASESISNPPSLGAHALRSPAKRQPASPDRDTLRSPARRIGHIALPGSTMKKTQEGDTQADDVFSFGNSLLQSAAKRPQSPIKGFNFEVSLQPQQSQSAMKASLLLSPPKRAMPGLKPVTEPRPRDVGAFGEPLIMKPLVLGTPCRAPSTRPSDKLMSEEQAELDLDTVEEDVFNQPLENLEFPGRLSAVLPRYADPAWKKDMGIVDESQDEMDAVDEPQADSETVEDVQEEAVVETEPITEASDLTEDEEDSMVVDEDVVEADISPQETEIENRIPTQSPMQEQNPMYQLREKDLEPQDTDSESDDEGSAPTNAVPVTPTPFGRKTPKASRASIGGFSALADRLGSWKASTPVKMAPLTSGEKKAGVLSGRAATPKSNDSPASTHFFDDEMTVRAGMEDLQTDDIAEIMDPDFDDMDVTEEDVELAQEANEMSLMESDVLEEVVNTDAFDDTLSEASQEYGDENEMPSSMVPTTPVRPVMKTFNTTTKVPLKPADDSSPTPLKKRSFSTSRVAPKRPSGPTSSGVAIPYSSKGRKSMPATIPESPSAPSTPVAATPSKSDLWSSLGTPARTPRRDLNPAILRGAVVFVDVYTSEGADASSIFVDLLTQMGAKCMKSWSWNPTSSENDMTSSKVGITHVVFKDGSKRTLEKVRESNGVVQCVGVSWVLDCERLNDWVEESPYKIDTSNVPRGGARRRKSMEPKALANMNGTLVTSPTKGGSRTTPSTPSNRRQSTQWMYTPSEQDEDEDMEDFEWSEAILTPVPKTPAPEAIARYAANLDLESASADDDDDDDDDLDESPTKDALLMRTCPPKKSIREMGAGLLSQTKDDGVLMRLMAARRKSLQFAPKIGSPLARTWK
ncbi:hypothetical protein SNK03_001702 [Fusarium graminearum]|uniref:BRCT domain-containing protein n=1 Tax=Gibberella zeae TaxID=5518 RepID=A0A2H3FXZ0_GIBZA|nr:hypothetical protein FG05_01488 [Fusarium graminearum]KAI6764841.1 hypothetical protein HG531_012728 [Fusarium graminearum]PCD22950.1 hypothetical protein FGRA07_04320 [Fusarium graminearum]CAF3592858.1 unnamed protein product [Fusarium graminearum]CAG1963064.1 unnamed protein product [Fusarium graminearum]